MASGNGKGGIWAIVGLVAVVAVIWSCVERCSSDGEDRPLSPDNIGSWQIQEFVDSFGDGTGRRFISQTFRGRFSIPGAEGAAFVRFMITGTDSIELEIFRYGSSASNRVGHNRLQGTLEDAEGNRFSLSARITDVNLLRHTFDRTSANHIHNALLKGNVRIRLSGEGMAGRMNNNYSFDISDFQVRGYSNAFRQLTGN